MQVSLLGSTKINVTEFNLLTQLPNYAVLKITGSDAEKYLQGQLTADLSELNDNNWVYACQCDFKGKTWSISKVFRFSEGFYLVVHRGALENTLRELKKFAVFSQVEIKDDSERLLVLGAIEESPFKHLNQALQPGSIAISNEICRLQISDERAIYVASKEQLPEELRECNADDANLWEKTEISEGIPEVDEVNSGEFVPQMMNAQCLGAISFTKGCYLGQETVARTKYLGKNKRAGTILVADTDSMLETGEILELRMGENWKRAGTVLRTATYQGQTWCFAVTPNDLEESAVLRSKNKPDMIFETMTLPYSLED